MTESEYLRLSGLLSESIRRMSAESKAELLRLLGEGVEPAEAVKLAMAGFNDAWVGEFAIGLSAVMAAQDSPGLRPGVFGLPPVKVTRVKGEAFGTGSIKELKKAANERVRQIQHGGYLVNADTGWRLGISKDDRKKITGDVDLTMDEIRMISALESLASRAVLAEMHGDHKHENPDVKAMYRLYAPVEINGKLYRAKLTVREYLTEEEKRNARLGITPSPAGFTALNSGQPTTGRKTNIPDPETKRNLHALSAVRLEAMDIDPGADTVSIAQLLRGAKLNDGQPIPTPMTVKSLLAMPLTGSNVLLSTRLHGQAKDTDRTVAALVRRHMDGMKDARALALDIYEGYGFRAQETLRILLEKALPKYLKAALWSDSEWVKAVSRASALKTPALKAAYMQALEAVGEKKLDKLIDTAYQEKMRYFANRIAVTEMHREYSHGHDLEYQQDEELEYVQIRLSKTHPQTDICDLHANTDRWGLGKGIYPKNRYPKPPFHPFCRCYAIKRYDIEGQAVFKPGATVEVLMKAGAKDAAKMLGSRSALDRFFAGDNPALQGMAAESEARERWRKAVSKGLADNGGG